MDKRDNWSNKPELNDQIVIKSSLNLIKGKAGNLSDKESNPKRGQVSNNCKATVNNTTDTTIIKSKILDKRDKKSINPGLNDQEKLKDSIIKMDGKQKGGEEAGDVAGKKKEGDDAGKLGTKINLEDEFGCKICGQVDLFKGGKNNHIFENHSQEAILIASEIVDENIKSGDKKPKFNVKSAVKVLVTL